MLFYTYLVLYTTPVEHPMMLLLLLFLSILPGDVELEGDGEEE